MAVYTWRTNKKPINVNYSLNNSVGVSIFFNSENLNKAENSTTNSIHILMPSLDVWGGLTDSD